MHWHRIIVSKNEEHVSSVSAVSLAEVLGKALRDAGAPNDFEAWHLRITGADHVFYLSPKACEVSLPLLGAFKPQPCPPGQPDLGGFRKMRL